MAFLLRTTRQLLHATTPNMAARHSSAEEMYEDRLHGKVQAILPELDKTKHGEHLPIYILLGPGQSGKTTLLRRMAERTAPFALPTDLAEGPTPDCAWWRFNDVIILDTAGRYASPIDGELDRTEWRALVHILRRHRKRVPISGFLLSIKAETLALQREDDLCTEASILRGCLDTAIRELRVQCPVYLLLTCCDRIEGFSEFVGSLPALKSQQLFGYIQDEWPPLHDSLEPMCTEINERLRQVRLALYNKEQLPTGAQRWKSWCFPEEVQALQEPLRAFMRTLFGENSWQLQPWFRGIFLCSARQGGASFSLLRRRWHEDRAPKGEEGCALYFVQDLFPEVLWRDRGLVQPLIAIRRVRRAVRS
jgi:type VI secretion system protein ImpL